MFDISLFCKHNSIKFLKAPNEEISVILLLYKRNVIKFSKFTLFNTFISNILLCPKSKY